MKNLVLVLFLLVCMLSFTGIYGQKADTLIGRFDRDAFLEPTYKEWFNSEYDQYPLQYEILKKIDFNEKVFVKIFLGTWCSDSRREVPRFLKITDAMGVSMDQIEMIGLNRKKSAPGFSMEKWGIDFVPTFIFMSGDTELGRIIETPDLSLEEDIFHILHQK